MKYSMSMSKSRPNTRRKKITKSPSHLSDYSRIKKYNSKNVKTKRVSSNDKFKFLTGKFNKDKVRKILYIIAGVGFFVVCTALIVVGVYLKNLQNSLPSPNELVERSSDQSTQIFDRNGELLYTVYGDQNREFVSIDKIPEHTKWALLAGEDIEFYQHKGLDYMGILRSALNIVAKGGIRGGGSTITQQLVKNTLLYDILGDEAYSQTYSRKIKEILITMQVEQTFTKDEILQMYMNEVPLGGVNYGFQAAANAYFGKDVSELTLAESALLVGLIQSPGRYSPLFGTDPDMAKVRQEYVLGQLEKHEDLTGISDEQIEAARSEELVYKSKKIDIKAPHFVFYVKQLLESEFGIDRVERGGLKVTTSLDYSIQQIAEEEVRNGIAKYGNPYKVQNGASVVVDPNSGDILAMVGSIDYWNTENPKIDGNVNIATSPRQVGSSAKPYTYLSAFTKGYSPGTLAPDIEMSFGNYKPTDWDRKYEGIGTIRKNLGRSRNVPAVYTLQLAGIDTLLQTTEKLGITTLKNKADYGLALALGAGEMKLVEHGAAFGAFANEGEMYDTVSVLKVEDSKGEVLKEVTDRQAKRVFSEQEIYLLNYVLCDLGGHGDRIGQPYSKIGGKNLCFKTGTTDGPRDLTTVMYHKNLVVAVWAGNNDNTTVPGAWGSSVPLPIAYGIMNRLVDRYPVELFTRPSGILSATVCTDTGAIAGEGVDCPKEATVYISGRAPQVDNREKVYICKDSGLISTNLDIAQRYGLVEERILLSTQLENPLQRDSYLKALGGSYITSKPNSGNCTLPLGENNAPVVEISSPTSGSIVKKGQNINITGVVRVLDKVSSFNVAIDNNSVSGSSVNQDGSFSITYNTSPLDLGTHTLTVSVTDGQGKTGIKSVQFNLEGNTNSISISSPSNGVTVAFPVNLQATVNGITPNRVKFFVTKDGGSYTRSYDDNSGADGWSAVWDGSGAGSGTFSIYVQAFVGSQVYQSNTIKVSN